MQLLHVLYLDSLSQAKTLQPRVTKFLKRNCLVSPFFIKVVYLKFSSQLQPPLTQFKGTPQLKSQHGVPK